MPERNWYSRWSSANPNSKHLRLAINLILLVCKYLGSQCENTQPESHSRACVWRWVLDLHPTKRPSLTETRFDLRLTFHLLFSVACNLRQWERGRHKCNSPVSPLSPLFQCSVSRPICWRTYSLTISTFWSQGEQHAVIKFVNVQAWFWCKLTPSFKQSSLSEFQNHRQYSLHGIL